MQTILVAVDESGAALRAVTIAADLAAALGARLVAVSIVNGVAEGADAVRAVQRRVQFLGRAVGIDVDVRTLHGHTGDELIEQARAIAADLVVVGCLDQPGPIGDAAQQVLRSCRIPVLVVPLEG